VATRDAAALLSLAESVADGSAIDWDAAAAVASPDDAALLKQLRIVTQVATLHRTLPANPGDLTTRAGGGGASVAAIGRWAHLHLIQRIGQGSSGEVYRAWDPHLEREVALKLLSADDSGGDLADSRTAREGRLLARVRHSNVVTVYGVAVHDGRVGMWMELIRGETLEALLATRGPLSAREAALIGIDLCRAIAAIHAAGVVHRDIKAQNVMREEGGRIVLMDFGTGRDARPANAATIADWAGTPLYLAPEIFDGATASPRTDLYSVGVLLYRLVTGSFPVRATTVDELHRAHASGAVVRLRDARPDLPTAAVKVIDRATARDPGSRYATAGELETDLVAALDDSAASPSAKDLDRRRSIGVRRTGFVAGALAAAILVLAIAVPALRNRRGRSDAAGPVKSIAVLPLANLSGDPAQEYFADAMTDELISTLGQLRGINVISRTSAVQFKHTNKSAGEIAAALHADAVLEGSVFVLPAVAADQGRGAKRARINARLIYAGSDLQIWNRTFEKVFDDVLALQSEVAAAVADGIHLELTPTERQALAGPASRNGEAQEAYLQGRSYLTNASGPSLTKAREWLERAVALDPQYARAHSALAVCYVWLEAVGTLPRAEARPMAVNAATRALDLDPGLAEAHAVLADVYLFYDWDRARAGTVYRRALELNPSYSFARQRHAWYLASLGQLDDALGEARLAADVDPLSAEASGVVGMMLYFSRQYDGALQQMRRAAALEPGGAQEHNGLARVYAAEGHLAEAILEAQQAVQLSGEAPPYVGELARLYAAAGETAKARELLARLQQMATDPRRHVPSQSIGYVYAALGDNDRAVSFLEQSISRRETGMLWAGVDPGLDRLRQDPRFAALLQRVASR